MASINDGISYSLIDHLSTIILQEHQGCATLYLIKTNIKEAYRILPIHLEDQPLLRVC